MRTMRLSLAGAVILASSGSLGGPVLAQHDPVVVTGPENKQVYHRETKCFDHDQVDVYGDMDGWDWFRGWSYTCQDELSDPRVSGLRTGTYNDDCFGLMESPCISFGTEEIVGPDGTWVGSFRGTLAGDVHTFLRVMTGTGDYEGLTFLWHGSGTLDEPTGTGIIYAGVPAPEARAPSIPTVMSAEPPTESALDPAELPVVEVASDATPPDGTLGAVFVQPNGVFPPTHYVLGSDGTVFSLSPFWGPGAGLWEPNDDDGLSMSVVHADADASLFSEQRGSTVIHAIATYDVTTDSLLLDWRSDGLLADGSEASATAGSAIALRRHLAPMPDAADVETPPDPGWRPVLGRGAYDDGRGGADIDATGENQALHHADGTGMSLNPFVGDAAELWAPAEDKTVGSSWWAPAGMANPPLVWQATVQDSGGSFGRFGVTEEGWWGTFSNAAIEVEPLDAEGALPPQAESAAWPERGMMWIEEGEGGPAAYLLMHADGTVFRMAAEGQRAPSNSPGMYEPFSAAPVSVGSWYPTADGGFAFTTKHRAFDPTGESDDLGLMTMAGEGRSSEDGEGLIYDYRTEWTPFIGDTVAASGSVTASRFHLGDQPVQ